MRVAVIGGTGFVGKHIVAALQREGHTVSVLVRPGSENKAPAGADRVTGSLEDANSLSELIRGNDAVIYNVGLLREFPSRGITFEAAQYQGVVDTVNAMQTEGVSRLVLMSAIGVKDPGTKYQSTKYRAEQHALNSSLDVTVLRPSVVFGDPQGTMEFATQLHRDMVRPPLPAVSFAGVEMAPIAVEDVADAFAAALADENTVGKTFELAGPEVLDWPTMVQRVAAAVDKKKILVPMPIWLMRVGATLFDWLPFYPVTRDQLTMLAEGNTAPIDDIVGLIGREPKAMTADALAYLSA